MLKSWRAFLALILLAVIASPAWAMTVLTSIKPIQMITVELTQGVTLPEVLLKANVSPHDYALRPSDVKRIHHADVMIWFGKGLEPFLEKSLVNHPHVITISALHQVPFIQFDADHHGDGHHHHGMINPHFWLGINTVSAVAKGIVAQLVQFDPKHAAQYRANLAAFESRLQQVNLEIETQLAPLSGRPFYVFHDAYHYFEKQYHLNQLGHFTVSPERKPGARTLIQIRQTLAKIPQVCVFSEPQFKPAVIDAITRGTSAKQGELDPLGSNIEVGVGSYFRFLQQISQSYADCLH